MLAPQRLVLKTDSQVMLIKNIDEQLVNGSIGKVIAFVDLAGYAAMRNGGGEEVEEEGGATKARWMAS